jgi:protease I
MSKEDPEMAPKVLIITGDAAEDLEFFYPYQRLLEAGYDVHVAAPERKKLQFVVHDFVEDFETYTEKLGHMWPSDMTFDEVDTSDYVALVMPGGRAPEHIRNNPDCKRIVQEFFGSNRPIAQECHAPLVSAAAGVLQGRKTAAFPMLESDVAAAGATFVNAEAVVDGNLVSARAWNDHPAWMREFMRMLQEYAPVARAPAGAAA